MKNIQSELLEERLVEEARPNNNIVYIQVGLHGVPTEAMIDMGANVSLIDRIELNRIQENNTEMIPTLPINNITIIGATGKQNKTIKQQVRLNVTNKGIGIPMEFLVAQGLPFRILIGCDMLLRHSAIINLASGKVTLRAENCELSAEIIGSISAPQYRNSYYVRESNRLPIGENNIVTESSLWLEKLEEIMAFQGGSSDEVSVEEKRRLIKIYNRYGQVFSDSPGKAKNFLCELKFKDSVSFNRRSYPIAHALKEAARTQIQRMVNEDIIERSNSPYTSPLVAIPKKDGQVRLCLDARELNRMLINDRTSPGAHYLVISYYLFCFEQFNLLCV